MPIVLYSHAYHEDLLLSARVRYRFLRILFACMLCAYALALAVHVYVWLTFYYQNQNLIVFAIDSTLMLLTLLLYLSGRRDEKSVRAAIAVERQRGADMSRLELHFYSNGILMRNLVLETESFVGFEQIKSISYNPLSLQIQFRNKSLLLVKICGIVNGNFESLSACLRTSLSNRAVLL